VNIKKQNCKDNNDAVACLNFEGCICMKISKLIKDNAMIGVIYYLVNDSSVYCLPSGIKATVIIYII
jgi:hypothetical protein